MADVVLALVVLAILGAAVVYIRKEKKRGVQCIGCPAAAQCARNCNAASSQCSCQIAPTEKM